MKKLLLILSFTMTTSALSAQTDTSPDDLLVQHERRIRQAQMDSATSSSYRGLAIAGLAGFLFLGGCCYFVKHNLP